MNKKDSNKNVFDEIDRDIEKVKTTMKLSRHERMLKIRIKMLKGVTAFLFILSVILIYPGVLRIHKGLSIYLGIIGLFVTTYGLVCLKLISKSQTKTGDKK